MNAPATGEAELRERVKRALHGGRAHVESASETEQTNRVMATVLPLLAARDAAVERQAVLLEALDDYANARADAIQRAEKAEAGLADFAGIAHESIRTLEIERDKAEAERSEFLVELDAVQFVLNNTRADLAAARQQLDQVRALADELVRDRSAPSSRDEAHSDDTERGVGRTLLAILDPAPADGVA